MNTDDTTCVAIEAVRLSSEGGDLVVSLRRGGRWIEVIREAARVNSEKGVLHEVVSARGLEELMLRGPGGAVRVDRGPQSPLGELSENTAEPPTGRHP